MHHEMPAPPVTAGRRVERRTSRTLTVLRRFEGRETSDVHLLVRPVEAAEGGGVLEQTTVVYAELARTLAGEGISPERVVAEKVLFRDIRRDHLAFRAARERFLKRLGRDGSYRPASVFIEQPPLEPGAGIELLAHAVASNPSRARGRPPVRSRCLSLALDGKAPCACDSCAEAGARVELLGSEKHIHSGAIFGSPGGVFEETFSMFQCAAEILRREGASFHDVVRTWIYFRDMDRDYAEFNRARRQFFHESRIGLYPASTGINGTPFPDDHAVCLGFQALQSEGPRRVEPMTTDTLNEAPEYGSFFSRGLRVEDRNKTTLFVSGTASIDEAGRTVHEGDVERQIERMVLNIERLLARQEASFRDAVSGVTYLKRSEDAPLLRALLERRGVTGFPNALVKADVCRPELLCEMEVTALVPAR